MMEHLNASKRQGPVVAPIGIFWGGCIALLLLLYRGPALLSRAYSNVGLAVLGRTLAVGPDQISQQMAAQAEELLQRAVTLDTRNRGGHLGLGITYTLFKRPQSAFDEWNKVTSLSDHQVWERSLWYRVAAALEPGVNGGITDDWYRGKYIILDSFASASAWQACPWCQNGVGDFGASQGALEISCRSTVGMRGGFTLLSTFNTPMTDPSDLVLRLKGSPRTLLTMEIVVDGERTRPFSYQPVPTEWETWTIPIHGSVLNEMLIGIGEPKPVQTSDEYHLFIDWIALR